MTGRLICKRAPSDGGRDQISTQPRPAERAGALIYQKGHIVKIANSVVIVTGANRGLGATYVRLALARGARKVYAAARKPESIAAGNGVVPITLDITDPVNVAAVAREASDVTIVINNAAISLQAALRTRPTPDPFASKWRRTCSACTPLRKRSRRYCERTAAAQL